MAKKVGLLQKIIMPVLMLLTFIVVNSLTTVAAKDEIAMIDGKDYPLYIDKKAGIIINRECHSANGKFDCQAAKALKKASFKTVKIEGGANPGAVMCAPLGGRVVLSVDARKNETTYCQFPDGSLVANGTITFHARQNDQ